MQLNILTVIIIVTVLISLQGFNRQDFLYKMAFVPYEVKEYQKNYKFITHIFVHADFGHLLFNMFSLYFLGDALLNAVEIEQYHISDGLLQSYGLVVGSLHFLFIYILGGLASTFWPLLRNHDNPSYLSVGASGSVSAIIFAMILWNPFIELQFIFLPGIGIPSYIFGPLFLVFEFWAFKRNKTNIAHDAHIGGAFFGLLYVLIINIDKGKNLITHFIN